MNGKVRPCPANALRGVAGVAAAGELPCSGGRPAGWADCRGTRRCGGWESLWPHSAAALADPRTPSRCWTSP